MLRKAEKELNTFFCDAYVLHEVLSEKLNKVR